MENRQEAAAQRGGAAIGMPRRAAALRRMRLETAASSPPPSLRAANWHMEALRAWSSERGGRPIACCVLNMNRTLSQHISHPGPKNMQLCLEQSPWYHGGDERGTAFATTRFIDPERFTDATLATYDVVIVPGGSATSQAKRLGPRGCDALARFVERGGGFVGVCAGAFLASAGYWRRRRASWFSATSSKTPSKGTGQRAIGAPSLKWPEGKAGDAGMDALAADDAPWLLRADVVLSTKVKDSSRGAWERGGAMLPLRFTKLGRLLLWDEAGDLAADEGAGDVVDDVANEGESARRDAGGARRAGADLGVVAKESGASAAAACQKDGDVIFVRYHNGPILAALSGESASDAGVSRGCATAQQRETSVGFDLTPLASFGGDVADAQDADAGIMVGSFAIAANRCRSRFGGGGDSGSGGIVCAISPHPESTHADGRMDCNIGQPRLRRIIQRAVMLAAGVFEGGAPP